MPRKSNGEVTQAEVARRLGISKSQVQIIELRALAKLAKMLGDPGPWERLPKWVKEAGEPGKQGRKKHTCRACGGEGHNARTCPQPEAGPKVDVEVVRA